MSKNFNSDGYYDDDHKSSIDDTSLNEDKNSDIKSKNRTAQIEINIEVSPQEWEEAKKMQLMLGKDNINFKLRKKDFNFNHSFLSIMSEKENRRKLFCLANNSQYLGMGKFGKVKLAVDEDGNYVAVKITGKIKNNKQPPLRQNKEEDEKEQNFEKAENRYHGGFTVQSPSKRNIHGNLLEQNETIEKRYQIIEYLGRSLKDILGIKSNTKDVPSLLKKKMLIIELSDIQKTMIAIGILNATLRLHAKGKIHCDLHEGNILVNIKQNTIEVNLADFGLAKELKYNFCLLSELDKDKEPKLGKMYFSCDNNTSTLRVIFRRPDGNIVQEELKDIQIPSDSLSETSLAEYRTQILNAMFQKGFLNPPDGAILFIEHDRGPVHLKIAAPEICHLEENKMVLNKHVFFSRYSDIFALGRILEEMLGLKLKCVKAMRNANYKNRPTINDVILELEERLKEAIEMEHKDDHTSNTRNKRSLSITSEYQSLNKEDNHKPRVEKKSPQNKKRKEK